MTKLIYFAVLLTSLAMLACKKEVNDPLPDKDQTNNEIPEYLAFDSLILTDLSDFQTTGDNWSVAGAVWSDYQESHHLQTHDGTGVLVNIPSTEHSQNIATKFEHGDLEIRFEAMIPNGSNSGVYFQGRYEVQLFDSWGVESPSFSDLGGIYQRWDETRPEGRKGYEGVSPILNAGTAPGLWQRFHILFRAPRFDQTGQKISNAKFEFVYLNDQLIHENVEVSGPTRAHQETGEAARGPLYFQGDHGPVAFRNIHYKSYGLDTLVLSDLSFQLFEGKYDHIPDFDTLTPTNTGTVDYFNLDSVTALSEGFAVVFEGNLLVPAEGMYLFETTIDDGGDLFIDSQLVVHNEGEPGRGIERGLVHLTKGSHPLKMTFYQDVWSSTLLVYYEGPGISRRSIGSFRKKAGWEIARENQPLLILEKPDTPALLRSFVMVGKDKLTHTISVGDPTGLHYSYDLTYGVLVKCWKGTFADVTDMWRGRGESQVLQPQSPSIFPTRVFPLAKIQSPDSHWPEFDQETVRYKGYRIDKHGRPVFRYTFFDLQIEDQIIPHEETKLTRTISLEVNPPGQIYLTLGNAPEILYLANGLYSMDGQYYLECNEPDLLIRHQGDRDELIAPLRGISFSYNLRW